MDTTSNGWDEWRNFVILELQRISQTHQELAAEVKTLRVEAARELAALKTKAGIWGLLGGLLPVLVAIGIAIALSFSSI